MIKIAGTDIETTGLLHPDHRIIEACVSLFDYDPVTHDFVLLKSKTWRIDPQRNIDAGAFKVHNIAATDLIGKPKWVDVAQEIRDALDEAEYVVAHNGMGFDFLFYLQEFDRVKVKEPDIKPIDTMLDGRFATPLGKAPNLQELCFACGVDYDPEAAHAASYDVAKMMECFFFGLRRGVFSL